MGTVALVASTVIFLAFLVLERLRLDSRRESIPLRITVTGTRGKTTVTRMLAAILREDGRKVAAKTTGSSVVMLMPDGSEIGIRRRGLPSIIEQKNVIHRAAAKRADCLVAEVMSLQPENHYVESQRILRPQMVLITNVRLDHTDAMGETEEEIADVLGLDIPPGARVLVPHGEVRASLVEAAQRAGGHLLEVSEDGPPSSSFGASQAGPIQFSENLVLARAAARELGIDDRVIERGIESEILGSGNAGIWQCESEEGEDASLLVDGFSANDPDSSLRLIDNVRDLLPEPPRRNVALVSFRRDRADRTVQWADAIKGGAFDHLDQIYVIGLHARAVARRVPGVRLMGKMRPDQITESIRSESREPILLFGLGNFVGAGEELVAYWKGRYDAWRF